VAAVLKEHCVEDPLFSDEVGGLIEIQASIHHLVKRLWQGDDEFSRTLKRLKRP
jgi:hypothetical protein